MPQNASKPGEPVSSVADVTCLGCCCLCDDLLVRRRDGEIVEIQNVCELGRAWFAQSLDDDGAEALVEGKPASIEATAARAAEILLAAHYPLLFGLTDLTVQGQRRAIAIAEKLPACIDSASSVKHEAHLRAVQAVGQVTCTYGEIAARGDLVIYWGADPASNQPRHAQRYTLLPRGTFVPAGRAGRRCVVIHTSATETEAWADRTLRIKEGCDFEAATVLRALIPPVKASDGASDAPGKFLLSAEDVLRQTGIELSLWRELAAELRGAQYGALFFGEGITSQPEAHLVVEALSRLVIELNDHTRFVLLGLPDAGNAAGADEVLTWTTGYPHAVNFARGYPRYFGREYRADELLARGEPDAALLIGTAGCGELPAAAKAHLRSIPRIAIDWRPGETAGADVYLRTARPGVESEGTTYRGDGVPIRLRATRASRFPSAEIVLDLLEREVDKARAKLSADASGASAR